MTTDPAASSPEYPNPPVGSCFSFARFDGGVEFTFGPKSVRHEYIMDLMLSFSIALGGIMYRVGFWIRGESANRIPPVVNWIPPVVVAGSTLYLLFATIRYFRNSVAIIAGRDGLTVNSHRMFRSSFWHVSQSQIQDLLLGYRAVLVVADGRMFRLPIRFGRSQMRWFVTVMRQELDLPLVVYSPLLPTGSQIECRNIGEAIEIIIPPQGKKYWPLLWFVFGLWIGVPLLMCALAFCFESPPHSWSEKIMPLSMIVGSLSLVCGPMCLHIRNTMKHPARFEISADKLTATWPLIRGRHRRDWHRDQIEEITMYWRVGIEIWCKNKARPTCVHCDGTAEERAWIVATIKDKMNLPSS